MWASHFSRKVRKLPKRLLTAQLMPKTAPISR